MIIVTILMLLCGSVLGSPTSFSSRSKEALTIRILHSNDMHARFEETSRLSTLCTPQDSAAKKCYGGFARIATLVREARNSTIPALFLNAGDTYQGSVWYNFYKWKIVAQFLNLLRPDAISLGNHEFDDNVAGLVPFIKNASFPVLTTNLDLREEPTLKATKLSNSTILLINGTKIGVIGYLTPDTKILASAGKVIFKDEIPCIREEARKLKSKGVNILIALGHSGFDMDKKIAEEVEDIDLVIGGHTNTFLYNGTQPDLERIEGFYPTQVIQKSGRKVYVVQAYAYTKYLGNITVSFDKKGEITKIQGNPILVDGTIKQAQDVLDELEKLRPAVSNFSKTVIGKTRVLIDGDSKHCRHEECNFGNFITDAMIDYNAAQYAGKDGWTDASVAIHNSGSIRSSITRFNDDKITMADVLGALPFNNAVLKVSMTGEQILSMLEWSVSKLKPESFSDSGAFLQVSGIQVVYDLYKPINSKVVSVIIRCAACRVPTYNELDKNTTYQVLMPDFIQQGGDGYYMLENLENHPLGVTAADILVDYVKSHSPVHPEIEWRIVYTNTSNSNSKVNNANSISQQSFGILFLSLLGLLILY